LKGATVKGLHNSINVYVKQKFF